MSKIFKNFFELLLISTLFCLCFIGCSEDNDGFIEVASVTFTTAGETKTLSSKWYIHTSPYGYEDATQEEYDSAEFKFKASVLAGQNVSKYTISIYTDQAELFSGNIRNVNKKPYYPGNITDEDIGKYFYIYAHDLGSYHESYYKIRITGISTSYIKVKVINSSTIIIKYGERETTYTVTSYSIQK